MKFLSKNQTKTFNNSNTCTAIEYPINDPDINIAVIKINGRYPETGRTVNLVCKELVYISEGNGKVIIEGKEISLHQGDVVLIEKGEKYYWDGNLTMVVPCTPAWYPEQHKEVV